jgi:TPR repeat protein
MQNDHAAQFHLGMFYAEGKYTATNLPDAYVWFSLAARAGDAKAQANADAVAAQMEPGQWLPAFKRFQDLKAKLSQP